MSKHSGFVVSPSTITPAAEPSMVSSPVSSGGRPDTRAIVAGALVGNSLVSKRMVSAAEAPMVSEVMQGGPQLLLDTWTHSVLSRSATARVPVASIIASRRVMTSSWPTASPGSLTVMVAPGLAAEPGWSRARNKPAATAVRARRARAIRFMGFHLSNGRPWDHARLGWGASRRGRGEDVGAKGSWWRSAG